MKVLDSAQHQTQTFEQPDAEALIKEARQRQRTPHDRHYCGDPKSHLTHLRLLG